MANEHAGHRSRIRERVRKDGLENFHNYQVLEYALTFVIPYKDTNVIAHKLINKFGSFAGVLEADEADIATVEGMGEVSAHFLANLLKIYHYYEKDRVVQKAIVDKPQLAVDYVKPFLQGKLVEELYIVCLSNSSQVEGVEKISEGTSNEALAPIRKIIDKMNKAKVSNIIIAHNHPKGSPKPSADDDKFTKALVTSLTINGCHLIDHIIVGDKGEYFSYRRSGAIDKYREDALTLVLNKVAQPEARYEVDD